MSNDSQAVVPDFLAFEGEVRNDKAEKVLQLTIELMDNTQRKRDSAKAFNLEEKRLKQEIASLLADDRETHPTDD